MPKRDQFIHKLIHRLDRLDAKTLQNCVADLAKETSVYRQILDHLNEGVILLSSAGHLTYINRQALNWTGIRQEAQAGEEISKVILDKELLKFLQVHIAKLSEQALRDIKLLAPHEMNLRVRIVPLLEKNLPAQALVILTPLSLTTSGKTKAGIDSQAIISLAAGIAHEIGNPLNAIVIHLALLQKNIKNVPEADRKKLESTIEVLQNETLRLDKIIKNFLKATRRPPLRFKASDLNELLSEAVLFMAPELKKNNILIHIKTDKTIPPCLLDPERMHQVFINLIKNAMESMPNGGNLWIQTRRQEKVITLTFKDEGVGIPEDDLPHIFEAYFTTKEAGSGLGLMTVLNGVQDHGGRIELSSKVGQGTIFQISLPIRQPKLQLPNMTPSKRS